MKTLLYIIGGVVCLGLIIAAMYVALTIGLAVYIAHANNERGQQYALQQQQTEAQSMQQSMQRSITVLENGFSPDKKHDADELAGKLPSVFSDPEGYGTEDNWLASMTSREMAEMAWFAAHPGDPGPDLKVKAVVDTDVPQVHVEIDGFGAETVTSDLKPTFAWDPNGCAPLAKQLLGTTPAAPAVPVTEENDVLTHLLKLTGAELAAEDVRLSADLQAHPASWQDHEEAALLLTALALRNPGGTYTDNRPLLNRATAHLAVAQALRGETRATWPGLIAGAAIRTLSGRELDALAHLDNLSAQPDVPTSAKPWIAALRTLAKEDWREATVTPQSPLLLKIVWFRVLELDLIDEVATQRLLQVVPQPATDPNAAPDAQTTHPETLITDWGRIAGSSPFYEDSNDAVKNAEYKMDLEFHELDEILKTENASPFDLNHLDTVFAEKATDTVSTGADGKAVVHVIGPGGFKAVSLGHIFDGLIAKNPVPDPDTDAAQAQNLFAKVEGLFKGVPGYDFARLHLGFVEEPEIKKQYDDWVSAGRKWPIWEVAYSMAYGMPGYAHVEAFYRKAVPFGTVFEPGLGQRYSLTWTGWLFDLFFTK